MEETVVKEEGKETQKKREAKHVASKTVKIIETEVRKHEPSATPIVLPETNVRITEAKILTRLPVRLDVARPQTEKITSEKEEPITLKCIVPVLEKKPIEKRQTVPLSEEILKIKQVTPTSSADEKKIIQLQNVLPLKVGVVSKEPKFKPLILEKEAASPGKKTSLQLEEIVLPEAQVQAKIAELIALRAREGEAEEEEVKAISEMPDFYNIFSKGLAGLTATNRPVCIILPKSHDESYVDAVALMCRELYRIKKEGGGKPSPRILSTGSKEEVEKSLEAGDRIFIIDDSKCELVNLDKVKRPENINWGHLYDRLRELFSQDFGFVIFHLDEKWINAFISKLEKVAHVIPKLLTVKFEHLNAKIKGEIARMCWGFISSGGKTFDEVFCNAEKAFYDRLEEIGKDDWLMHCTKPQEGPESPEHRLLKALVVKIIAKERGVKRELIPKKILTEHKVPGLTLTVDVFVNDQPTEYIEVETLYGTGLNPIDKIEQTLKRYVDNKLNKVKVVMLPMPFLTYLKSLASLRRTYKTEHGIDVKFYTLDIENERLVPLEDIIRRLKELIKQIDEDRLKAQKESEISKLKKLGLTEEEVKGLISP